MVAPRPTWTCWHCGPPTRSSATSCTTPAADRLHRTRRRQVHPVGAPGPPVPQRDAGDVGFLSRADPQNPRGATHPPPGRESSGRWSKASPEPMRSSRWSTPATGSGPPARCWCPRDVTGCSGTCHLRSAGDGGRSPYLPQDTIDRSIRILLMPDLDGQAADSDWEALDAQVRSCTSGYRCGPTRCARRERGSGDLPPGCVGPVQGEVASARAGRRAGRQDTGHSWKDMVRAMAEGDLADAEAQREAGLRQQTPGASPAQDLAQVWPTSEAVRVATGVDRAGRRHNHDYWGRGRVVLRRHPREARTPPGSGGWSSRPQHHVEATGWWRHTTEADASSSTGPGGPCGSSRRAATGRSGGT